METIFGWELQTPVHLFRGAVQLGMQRHKWPFGTPAPAGDHLDTLRSDYAFIIAMDFVPRNLMNAEESDEEPTMDFDLYPNPSTDLVILRFHGDIERHIALFDSMGRCLGKWNDLTERLVTLSLEHLANGTYAIRVVEQGLTKTKTFVIQ